MELLEIYKNLCKNKRWYDMYCSTGEKSNGRILCFLNTNYRNLWVFETGYNVFKEIENIGRDQWIHNEHHGEEKEKQHTVNMLKSKIFSKTANKYYRNKKGLAFGDMLESNFTKEERWIMIYFTILNGYFKNVPNYIFNRVEDIVELMQERNISRTEYINLLKNFIQNYDLKDGNIFFSDYLYYDTFYKAFEGIDFLKIYLDSTKEEQKELKEFVNSGRKDRNVTKEQTCTISYKYKTTGSYVKSTLIDNAKIQYFTLMILDNEFKSHMEFFDFVLSKYSEFYNIDKTKLLKFIEAHEDVYKLIYEEIFGIVQYSLNFRRDNEFEQIEINIGEKIDDTDVNSIQTYNRVSTVLKRLAKINSNYRCELEDYFNCQYFTSKESHKNYVEVHHLIPRAVGNDFENSIEVVENYVALCPHCHRLLHFGEDVERKPALHNLYIKRKDKLKEKGIEITEKELQKYYLIEN